MSHNILNPDFLYNKFINYRKIKKIDYIQQWARYPTSCLLSCKTKSFRDINQLLIFFLGITVYEDTLEIFDYFVEHFINSHGRDAFKRSAGHAGPGK